MKPHSASVITQHHIQHDNDKHRNYTRLWTHKGIPIPPTHGWAMYSPLWVFWRKFPYDEGVRQHCLLVLFIDTMKNVCCYQHINNRSRCRRINTARKILRQMRTVKMPTLSPLLALQAVLLAISGAISYIKVDIMTICGFSAWSVKNYHSLRRKYCNGCCSIIFA